MQLFWLVVLLPGVACQGPGEDGAARQLTADGAGADRIVGNVADAPILQSEIEAPIELQLFDLEMQRYRLLRQSLEAMALERIENTGDSTRVAVLDLEPPEPPRIDVEVDPARTRPAGEAPVTIFAFCNFESPHCTRLQMQLANVISLFGDGVRYATRDYALAFHRNAGLAAEAAHCAREQGSYWRFHDSLFGGSGALDRARIDRAARATGLDPVTFAECLESHRHAPRVAADMEAASELAIDTVPAVFVNGLYVGNTVDASSLVWLIERELARLDVPSPRRREASQESTAPLSLVALLRSPHAGQGLALLAPSMDSERIGIFREGDSVGHALVLSRITENGIEFLNDGRLEWLSFDTGRTDDDPAPANDRPDEARTIMRPHRAVPVPLDRDEVLVRLSDRIALEEVLVTVPMKSGDYHQLRISEVRPGSLYELLGLEAGDVILGVNEMPVHEAENPLWDALEREGEVRVRVMRRGGLAHHYTYRFDDQGPAR
jgi:protein-disulfide isomerase